MAAFDFATVVDCSQLVNGPTHRAGGVLDLVLTNVPDLCNVHVHGNVGRSDHASLGVALNLSPAVAGFDVARRVPPKVQKLIGMPFVRLCLDLTGEVFSGVRPWFTILTEKSVELWSDSFQWLLWGEEEVMRPGLMVIVGELLSWSSQRIIVGAGTVLLRTRIYSAKHEELLIDSMRLRRLVTLRIAVGTLMTVPLPMPGGVHLRVMFLVRSLIFLPFVRLVVLLFLIRRGRLSCWVCGLTASSHETLLSCRRPVTLGLHSVALPLEHLLDLDPNGGVDPSGCFPMFFRKTASVLAPKLSCLFRRLLHGGEFPLEWRIADVTPIPKGPLSALVCNYQFCRSSVEGFLKVDRFAFWSFFGEIWGPAFSPVFIQEEIGYLRCSSWHRLCWSVGIRQGWRACARPDWFQCGLWQG